MTVRPRTAMLLAAGLGTRMRPLTEATAKPLLPLGGRSLLDHGLDRLRDAGVETVVVNAHWRAERVEARLRARAEAGLGPRTVPRVEEKLLETGGGVRAALPLLGPDPFYVVNGDAFWVDGPRPALARMADAFRPGEIDVVLLVHRTFQVQAETGHGDFALDPWGAPRRPREREVVPYIYAGVQLAAPTLLDGAPEGAFSMNLLWDRAIAAGRLRAVVHDGLWFHLSTPADLAQAESFLQIRAIGAAR
jgi:MurNAc alpha-1-phosphate uridylyltransferase